MNITFTKEISTRENWKEAFWETAFQCVNATHSVTRFSSVFRLLTHFSGNLQWDTSERNEAYGDKGNFLRWKLERSFLRKFLVMCEFISQSYTYVSFSSPLTLSLRKLRRASLDRIEAYADKGNFIRSKRERSFLRNFFLICEFFSPRYKLCLKKQFANTLFVEWGKRYLVVHRGPRWKRKCLHIITTEKLSERLLSDVWLHHTEFHTSPLGTVC